MRILPVILALGLAACAAVPAPKTAEQGVFETKATLVIMEHAATAYANLPRCSDVVPQPCSDQNALNEMKKAKDSARTAINTAEAVVRAGVSEDVGQLALQSAQAAIETFRAIGKTYSIKGVE